MPVIVGGLFTAVTAMMKERLITLLLAPPLLTVTVTVAVPLALATGVKARLPVVLGLV